MSMISWKNFFEQVPPYTEAMIDGPTYIDNGLSYLATPTIQLHCDDKLCNGLRMFNVTERVRYLGSESRLKFVTYKCKNCHNSEKIYALNLKFVNGIVIATKFGETPQFGDKLPAKMVTLLGPDKEMLLKGKRCENMGLGIAAFTYYRRVIENQRDRIFDEIIRVVTRVAPGSDVIQELRDAKKQRQFTSSIDAIKSALPDSLLLNGYNPLILLHSSLSEGVHNLSDEDCLRHATAIRTVMAQFALRLAETLRDDRELTEAINFLANPSTRKPLAKVPARAEEAAPAAATDVKKE